MNLRPDEFLLTAHALGEPLEPAEDARVEELLANDPALRAGRAAELDLARQLRAAYRAEAAAPPARSIIRINAAPEETAWRQRILRLAAVAMLSIGAIGATAWWTAQREIWLTGPQAATQVIFDAPGGLENAPAGRVELHCAPLSALDRGALSVRWIETTAHLRAGALPGRDELDPNRLLSLLPAAASDPAASIEVSGVIAPWDARRAVFRVGYRDPDGEPAELQISAGGEDVASARCLARGDDETGRHLALIEVLFRDGPPTTGQRTGLVTFALETAGRPRDFGSGPFLAVSRRTLAADLTAAPPALRDAISLTAFALILRGEPPAASYRMSDVVVLAEAGGSEALALAPLARRARELLMAAARET